MKLVATNLCERGHSVIIYVTIHNPRCTCGRDKRDHQAKHVKNTYNSSVRHPILQQTIETFTFILLSSCCSEYYGITIVRHMWRICEEYVFVKWIMQKICFGWSPSTLREFAGRAYWQGWHPIDRISFCITTPVHGKDRPFEKAPLA